MTLAPEFPFTAVVGQEALKTALLLNAIDPRVGGVLVSGPRGSAKSTLARALAAVLPEDSCGQRPAFVNLPLGASEDRLTGSLDLQRVLAERETAFQPGLLARADGGVLYVDEVNLLPDPLVDLLLDVAARGVNVVERDGISHSHPARFSLVGTMNPDEGELRPQLLDRFGLCLQLAPTLASEERVAIVRQREAFDRDPEAFMEAHADAQRALSQRLLQARQALADIAVPDWSYEHVASRCEAAGVEGLRADVTWHRAARAHAAWRGVDRLERMDLETVEDWVLVHRSSRSPDSPEPPASPPTGGEGNPGGPGAEEAAGAQGQWGAMPPVRQQALATALPEMPDMLAERQERASSLVPAGREGEGRQPGRRPGRGETKRPDWFATLVASPDAWPPRRLHYRRRRPARPRLHLVLLDTSGSTLSRRLLGRAKGLVEALAHQAYVAREQMAVLGFGNDGVRSLLARQRAPRDMWLRLEAVGAAGGTPMRAVIQRASGLIRQWQRREPGLHIRTYLITDGRTREPVADLPSLGDCILVDTEDAAVRRGRGEAIARQLGALYRPLPKGNPA